MSEKPWLEHYDKGVPKTFKPYPEITLIDTLRDIVRQKPEFPVLLFKGAPMCAMDLEQLSNSMAAALIAKGVKKGDRIALVLPNSPQSFIGFFGIWKTGAIAVPINPLYTESELEFALQECGASGAIVLSSFYNKVKICAVTHQGGIRHSYKHQGIPTASITTYVHPGKGEERRLPHIPATR